VGEHLAELVASHAAYEAAFAPEGGNSGARVRHRPAGLLLGRSHSGIKLIGLGSVDQLHEAFLHAVIGQERLVAARNDIDDGIANPNNVIAGIRHGLSPWRLALQDIKTSQKLD
jgi:hypothetical protein